MNFGFVVAIGVVIIVTRLASWAQKQQRIAQGRLPDAADDAPRQQGLLDVLRDIDQQLGQGSSPGVQRGLPGLDGRVAGTRVPVRTARRGPGGRMSTGPLGESLGRGGDTTGPLGETLGPEARVATWDTPPVRTPLTQQGLALGRMPGAVPARRADATVATRVTGTGAPPARTGRKAAAGRKPVLASPDADAPKPVALGAPTIERPKNTDPAVGGRRLAHALLQTVEGGQAAVILTEIFGPPVSQR